LGAPRIILAGPIGTGKSHVAIALGVEATRRRLRVHFTRAADLVQSLVEARDERRLTALDALGIARFAAQKRPAPTPIADEVTAELRELVRLRTRYVDEHSDRMRQLHRAVDLGFPEFTRHVRMNTMLATSILARYPTARSFASISLRKLARLTYDGRHQVGGLLARTLKDTAKISVGSHHSEAYGLQVKYTCSDMELLRNRIKQLDREIERKLQDHEVGRLLTTIDGIGARTAACLIAELGDPSRFRVPLRSQATSVWCRACGNRASARSPAPAAFRSEMRACVIGCGCRHWSPSGKTLCCAPITSAS